MATKCVGGQFDGYTLTTARDHQLCREGGGTPVTTTDDAVACAAAPVSSFAIDAGRQVDVTPLRNLQALFRSSTDVALLRRLSEAAAPIVIDLLGRGGPLADQLVAGLQRLASITSATLGKSAAKAPYSEADHAFFSELARMVTAHAKDPKLTALVDEVIVRARSLEDLTVDQIVDRLGPVPELAKLPVADLEFEVATPFGGVDLNEITAYGDPKYHAVLHQPANEAWKPDVIGDLARETLEASQNITAKATSLGALAASPQGNLRRVQGGYMRRFADCDIYYSPATGAHEVHGEIRRKYQSINGPNLLGLPITDETACPDGVGRYNHFARSASIYWSPTTGPFHLRGAIRFRWASTGWEQGPLGYPVRDQDGLSGLPSPDVHWSHFQGGMIFAKGLDGRVALAATVSAEQIAQALGATFIRRAPAFEASIGPFKIAVWARPGLYGVDVLGVDDWTYNFYASNPRVLRLRIRGFVSVPLFSDPTFEVELGLRFSTQWVTEQFGFPRTKTVVASLVHSKVRVRSIASSEVATMISDALHAAFTPDPGAPEVVAPAMILGVAPTGWTASGNLDFLDVMLMADGSLSAFVNPTPPLGTFRRDQVQGLFDAALARI